jgi:monofunctional glycosyltransferase
MAKVPLRTRVWNVITSPYRFFKVLCLSIGLAVILSGVGMTLVGISVWRSLPDLNSKTFAELQQQATRRVSDRLEDKSVTHTWVPLKDVSRDFLYSVVMSEDAAFFEHEGIDYEAVLSSMAENLRRKEAAFGGSTIPQQVVKNIFLKNEKTLTRKIKEALITRRLERQFTKNQILELYLNIAEFGPDLYGIEAASRHYFKKTPKQINALEGAFIAVMLPSPKRYHYAVFENKNLSKTKQKKIRRVLTDMYAQEFISERQYREYLTFSQIERALAGSAQE